MSIKTHLNFFELHHKSKGFFWETYPIKEINFQPSIEYQSFRLTAELHLTRKQFLCFLKDFKLIKKSFDNLSKTFLSPTRYRNLF